MERMLSTFPLMKYSSKWPWPDRPLTLSQGRSEHILKNHLSLDVLHVLYENPMSWLIGMTRKSVTHGYSPKTVLPPDSSSETNFHWARVSTIFRYFHCTYQWWRDVFRCRIDLLNFSMGFNIIAPYMDFLHLNWCIAEWYDRRLIGGPSR